MQFKKYKNKYYVVDLDNLQWLCIQSRNENQLSFDVSDYEPVAQDIIVAKWETFTDVDEFLLDALDYFGAKKFNLFEKFMDIIGN